MQKGVCEEEVKLELGCILTRNPAQLVSIKFITLHFRFRLMNASILHINYEYGARSELLPVFRHVAHLNVGTCRLTMPIDHSWRATSHISYAWANPATIKHIYNKSACIIRGCNVAFVTNDCWNFPYTEPVNESMMTRARFRDTGDYLAPGRCSLTNSVTTERNDAISSPNPHTALLWLKFIQ